MGRIYVTGDIHAEPDRFNMENFPEQKELTRDDYMIICGDFGLVWAEDKESKRETWWLHTPHFSWTGTTKILPDSMRSRWRNGTAAVYISFGNTSFISCVVRCSIWMGK